MSYTHTLPASTPGTGSLGAAASLAAAPATGLLRGEQVSVKDIGSTLADAAEEISRDVATKLEDKAHGKRKVGAADRPLTLAVAQCEAYLQKARALDGDARLQQFMRLLRQEGASPREAAARSAPRDAAQQFVLLEYARQQALADGAGHDEALARRIEEVLEDLWDTARPEIKANIETIDAASHYGAQDPGEIRRFQDTYGQLTYGRQVFGQATAAETLKLVLKQLAGTAGGKLALGLQSLIEATGQQLSQTRLDREKALLEALARDLTDLVIINTVHAGCRELIKHLPGRLAQGA